MNPFLGDEQSCNSHCVEPEPAHKSNSPMLHFSSQSNCNKFSMAIPDANTDQISINEKKEHFLNNFLFELSNTNLLKCKLFYFFFYAAFGSLFPLIGIYFKELGMSSTQAGILIGIRPLIEIFSASFWVDIAEKFNKVKLILILSLCSWIVCTISIATIKTPAEACVFYNGSNFILYSPYLEEKKDIYEKSFSIQNKRSINVEPYVDNKLVHARLMNFKSGLAHYSIFQRKQKQQLQNELENGKSIVKIGKLSKLPPNHIIGRSPFTIEYISNYNKKLHTNLVTPTFSHIVYKQNEVNEVFFLLFLIILIGEIFSSPANALVDAITIRYLDKNLDDYNKQRMFGSIGWAISMLLVGILLDHTNEFDHHSCEIDSQEQNYAVCFKIFTFFMVLSCLIASRFSLNFPDEEVHLNKIEMNVNKQDLHETNTKTFSPSFTENEFKPKLNTKFEFIQKFKSSIFAQRTNQFPQLASILRTFSNLKFSFLIIMAWFMGTGVGLVFSFLFWHLQDLGGTPTLFGIASIINHVSEIAAYFFSLHFIQKYGHTRILYLDLICNFFRFLYISYIDNAWLILPFELIQGVTHATVWATLCSILNQFTENENLKNNHQVILQLAYTGFGKGLGSIIGGMIIDLYGTKFAFALYAFASLFFIIIFFIVMSLTKYRLSSNVISNVSTCENTCKDEISRKQNKNLNANIYVTSYLPHGVPASSLKQVPIKIKIESNSNLTKKEVHKNDELQNQVEELNSSDVILNKSFRDWRITLNKNKNLN